MKTTNKFTFKKLLHALSLLIALLMPLSTVLAVAPPPDPNYPVAPNDGAVVIDKTAEWVGFDTAKVTLTVRGLNVPQGVDVVLLMDSSGSMDNGSTDDFSPCTNPDHEHFTVSFTKSVTYQRRTGGGGSRSWTNVDDPDFTVTLYCIRTVSNGAVSIKGYQVSNQHTSSSRYRESSSYGEWESWTGNDNDLESFLVRKFGGDIKDGVTFPNSSSNLGNYISDIRQTYSRSSNGCLFRIDNVKSAAKQLVDALIPNGSLNRVALVAFNDDAYIYSASGSYLHGPARRDNIKSFINDRSATGGTDYEDAFEEAADILNRRPLPERQSRPAYVIILSDGSPDADDTGTSEANALKTAGVKIFGVGISISDSEASILKSLSSGTGYYFGLDNSVTLPSALTAIGSYELLAGTEAIITDSMSEYFQLDYSIAAPSVTSGTLGAVTTDASGNEVITWTLGDITETEAKLTYYIKVKSTTPKGGTYPTNTQAVIDYENFRGNDCQKTFPVPELDWPAGDIQSITVNHYLWDDAATTTPVYASETISTYYDGETIADTSIFKKADNANYTYHSASPSSLTVATSGNVINIYYTAGDVPYTFNHYLWDDGETTTQLADPTTGTGKAGSTLNAADFVLSIPGYSNYSTSASSMTLDGDEENVINLYYTADPQTVTVNHYLWDDGATTTPVYAPETITGYVTGDVIPDTSIFKKPDDANFTFHSAVPTSLTLSAGEAVAVRMVVSTNLNEICIYYTEDDIPYTINHYLWDEGPTTIELNAPTTGVGKFEDVLYADDFALLLTGYTYDSADVDSISLDGEEENVINLYYTADEQTYVVKHYLKDTTTPVAPDKAGTGVTGQEITEAPIEIDGYSPVSTESVKITLVEGANEIIFYYEEVIIVEPTEPPLDPVLPETGEMDVLYFIVLAVVMVISGIVLLIFRKSIKLNNTK